MTEAEMHAAEVERVGRELNDLFTELLASSPVPTWIRNVMIECWLRGFEAGKKQEK